MRNTYQAMKKQSTSFQDDSVTRHVNQRRFVDNKKTVMEAV